MGSIPIFLVFTLVVLDICYLADGATTRQVDKAKSKATRFKRKDADERELLQDVNQITSRRYIPLRLSVFGPRSTVLATLEDEYLKESNPGQAESPIVAAGRGEGTDGRVIVFGYPDFLSEKYNSGTLVQNGVRWLAGDRKEKDSAINIALYNPSQERKTTYYFDNNDEFKLKEIKEIEVLSGAGAEKFDVLLLTRITELNEQQLDIVTKFLSQEKGLMVGSPSDGNIIEQHKKLDGGNPGNKMIGKYGIFWTNHWNNVKRSEQKFTIDREMNEKTHVGKIWKKLTENGDTPVEKRDARLIGEFGQYATAEEHLLMPQMFMDLQTSKFEAKLPTLETPVKGREDRDRVALEAVIVDWHARNAPANEITAHRASHSYPNLNWDNSRFGPTVQSKSVSIKPDKPAQFKENPQPTPDAFDPCVNVNKDDLQKSAEFIIPPTYSLSQAEEIWYSTGMYAKAGEVVEIDFPPSVNIKKYKVQVRIGPNNEDTSTNDETFVRWPKVDLVRTVNDREFKIASPFGGLMYIILPSTYKGRDFTVKFTGSVEAPTYIYKETSRESWKATLKNPGAPWGEMISKGVVIHSLPTDEALKKIKDPEEILEVFNEGFEGISYLGSLKITSATRFVPDKREDTGWSAYAGYPIVTLWHWPESMRTRKEFCKEDNSWGWWHEVGHNVQYDAMYMTESSDITNNIFAAYNGIRSCNRTELSIVLDRYSSQVGVFKEWKEGGMDFQKWSDNYDLAFIPYLEIADKYEWDSIRELHQYYNLMRMSTTNIPGPQKQRIEIQYVVLSQIVGENLEKFFDHWNIPLSQTTRECVRKLGMPDTDLDPMKPTQKKKKKN